jgi:hypothetical protein
VLPFFTEVLILLVSGLAPGDRQLLDAARNLKQGISGSQFKDYRRDEKYPRVYLPKSLLMRAALEQ